jgi:NADH-quinone oxidoreductase subunit J
VISLAYVAGGVAVIATIAVVTRAHAVHALLYLIVSLMSVAMIFALIGATFAAALEVIIYAGAIMVLFLFAVMLLGLGPEAVRGERRLMAPRVWWGPVLLCAVLAAELGWVLAGGGPTPVPGAAAPSPREVARHLYASYLLAVELASLLLLAGLVGAYHLGRRDPEQGSRAGGTL